jgi:hypothetical protein
MKKIVIFLISAILSMNCVNLYAQTEMNPTNGCSFRFVLESPIGTGWYPGAGIMVTVDGVEYGFVNLPWGTPSAEETLLLPSGEVHFSWPDGTMFDYYMNYFEIYNSLDELIYTSPEEFGLPESFFIYQNDCDVSINNYTSALLLYPNPASNVVYISGENTATVKVFNNIGQLINTYHSVNTINVSSYKAGIYIFSIITNERNTKAFKVLITK